MPLDYRIESHHFSNSKSLENAYASRLFRVRLIWKSLVFLLVLVLGDSASCQLLLALNLFNFGAQ